MEIHFVYILESEKDKSFYIGSTKNVDNRLWEHNYGRTGYSIKRRPWKLIYREEFETKKEALRRERYLKKLKSRKFIERLISLGR